MKQLLWVLILVAVSYSVLASFYFLTDSAYERLAASDPRTKGDVERILSGFHAVYIAESEEMSPVLRGKVRKEWQYWRYSRYPGFSIDVVYDQNQAVRSLWPEYE